MTNARLIELRSAMKTTGLQALALNPGPALTYITGLHYHTGERPIVLIIPLEGEPTIILPSFEVGKLDNAYFPMRHFSYGDTPTTWQIAFQQAAEALQLSNQTIGLEPTRFRFLEMSFLQETAPALHMVSAEDLLSSLRKVKSGEEVAQMRQAAVIAQEAFLATLPFIKPGVTERQVAGELTTQLLRHGSDPELPFTPIVASGPNSANPHATPSDRELQSGDPIVIDWGARCGDYVSDITRMVAVGPLTEEMEQIIQIVIQANAAGRQEAKPGIPIGQVDLAARKVIEEAGYGPYFTHRVGHGLGMEGHEPPYAYAENTEQLAVGNTFTIEPGIYVPGTGGARIEDDIVITPQGADSITTLQRDIFRIKVN